MAFNKAPRSPGSRPPEPAVLPDHEGNRASARRFKDLDFPDAFAEAGLALARDDLGAAEYAEMVDVMTSQFAATIMQYPASEPAAILDKISRSFLEGTDRSADQADRDRMLEFMLRAARRYSTSPQALPESVSHYLFVAATFARRGSRIERGAVAQWQAYIAAVARTSPSRATDLAGSVVGGHGELVRQHEMMPSMRAPIAPDSLIDAVSKEEHARRRGVHPGVTLRPREAAVVEAETRSAQAWPPNVVPFPAVRKRDKNSA